MLGFKDATNFERNNQSVAIIRDMLNKTDLELDEFWELCVTFQLSFIDFLKQLIETI